jgi:hypothetical protein
MALHNLLSFCEDAKITVKVQEGQYFFRTRDLITMGVRSLADIYACEGRYMSDPDSDRPPYWYYLSLKGLHAYLYKRTRNSDHSDALVSLVCARMQELANAATQAAGEQELADAATQAAGEQEPEQLKKTLRLEDLDPRVLKKLEQALVQVQTEYEKELAALEARRVSTRAHLAYVREVRTKSTQN